VIKTANVSFKEKAIKIETVEILSLGCGRGLVLAWS
jgi:hypothetical protein